MASNGFAWFNSGICAKCGRSSRDKSGTDPRQAGLKAQVCVGCKTETWRCTCPDLVLRQPPYVRL